ncbi:hypothetical protein [Novosphingobium sp. BW1]|uniref:hypothetical protein n=1 Tax=Novosphingobium sp. BW1 TaxID=2592621 RepID=UPI0011DE8893|nr:hypothetical protein [Novosphingobium sp. BW1]TYC86083.1 hypothetical protein FMM79_16065 [Novosphingobium sp. BW1]
MHDEALTSENGYTTLEWDAVRPVVVHQASTPAMSAARTIFEGTGTRLFVSGLPDGNYYFTIADAAPGAAPSPPLHLAVTHQSLSRALWLTALGALVFAAIVFVILRGARRER